jgi:hypothetical protein
MSHVYVTTYEVVGAGLPIAAEFLEQVDSAKEAHWAFVKEVDGVGFRPSHDGGLRTVFFAELPTGWRKVGREGKNVEAVPRKTSKAGKALTEAIAALPNAPQASSLASSLGFNPTGWALCDSGRVYFPTELSVIFPKKRSFVRLPRFEGDGFEPDATMLRALPESEFMRAVEDHNAEARRLREADAARTKGTPA